MDFLGQGAGPIPIGVDGSGLSAFPVETFETPLLDLTQVLSGLELIPAKPNYIPKQVSSSWVVEKISGTQTSPPTTRAGSDALHQNFFASSATSPTNANINAATTPCVLTGLTFALGGTFSKDTNATIFLDITSPAVGTGGFVLLAKLIVDVAWEAAG